jgi:hypothetical protein
VGYVLRTPYLIHKWRAKIYRTELSDKHYGRGERTVTERAKTPSDESERRLEVIVLGACDFADIKYLQLSLH